MNAGIDKPFEVIVETCPHCGSNQISHDGAIRWHVPSQRYRQVDVHDNATCEECGRDELKVVRTTLARFCIECLPAPPIGASGIPDKCYYAIIEHCSTGKLETRDPWDTYSKAYKHAQRYIIKRWAT